MDVLGRSNMEKLSTIVLRRQLLHFGKVVRQSTDHPLRAVTFIGDTLALRVEIYVCKVGRPRLHLPRELLGIASAIVGGEVRLAPLLREEKRW